MASTLRVDNIETSTGTPVMGFDNSGNISATKFSNLKIPVWTTATRPANPEVGYIGFNTDTDRSAVEIWNGTKWAFLDEKGSAGFIELGLLASWDPSTSNRVETATITTAKIYSVYNGIRSANYTVQYSDNGSTWTTAFSGVMSNNSSYGIQSGTNPGNGSYGAHRYWRYVEGSAVNSHHPRCSRIILTDENGNDYNCSVFVPDNTSDSGDYIIGTKTYDLSSLILNDVSGNNKHATLVNTTYSSASDGTMQFNGSSSYVWLTSETGLWVADGPRTLTGWINCSEITTQRQIFECRSTGDFPIVDSGQLRWHRTGSNYGDTATVLSGNNWFNVTWVMSSSVQKIYVNGVNQSISVLGGSLGGSFAISGPPRLGHAGTYRSYFQGAMGQFAIYNRLLSDAEILTNYETTKSKYGL